jgi:hypothetical protein
MLQAELKGKLPTSIETKEDILTSNVFSFLDYADRVVYLRAYLRRIGIEVSDKEAEEASLTFWPRLDDNTEPDVVIITRGLYILIEAKYISDFGPCVGERDDQLLRELKFGLLKAQSLNKAFCLVAITGDYAEPADKFKGVREIHNLIWTNWQSVAMFIEERLDKDLPQRRFAEDLYALLRKKNLRPFRGFDHLSSANLKSQKPGDLFFAAASCLFRGKFLGFSETLGNFSAITAVRPIFFKK